MLGLRIGGQLGERCRPGWRRVRGRIGHRRAHGDEERYGLSL